MNPELTFIEKYEVRPWIINIFYLIYKYIPILKMLPNFLGTSNLYYSKNRIWNQNPSQNIFWDIKQHLGYNGCEFLKFTFILQNGQIVTREK